VQCATLVRRLPGSTYKYDGPPTQLSYDRDAIETLFAARKAPPPSCDADEPAPVACGAAVNALCPYKASGVDLCCFEDDPDVPFKGTCRPCLGASAASAAGDNVIVWDGAWTHF
jgi:hypothetical protein